MNERINELVSKAKSLANAEYQALWDKGDAAFYETLFNKTFAELIVQECAEVSSWNGDGKMSGMIKHHFGVTP
jgi:hypothetical protein